MQGSFFFGGLALFFGILLFCPFQLKLRASITGRNGWATAEIRFLLIRVCIPFQTILLNEELICLDRILPDGGRQRIFPPEALPQKKTRLPNALFRALNSPELDTTWLIGTEDAARTAICAGLLKSAAFALQKALNRSVRLRTLVVPQFAFSCFRINLSGIASLRIADIIKEIMFRRGD